MNTNNIDALVTALITHVNDLAFCSLLDSGIDPGRAYDVMFDPATAELLYDEDEIVQ